MAKTHLWPVNMGTFNQNGQNFWYSKGSCENNVQFKSLRGDFRSIFTLLSLLTSPCIYLLHCLIFVKENINSNERHLIIYNYFISSANRLLLDLCYIAEMIKISRFYIL